MIKKIHLRTRTRSEFADITDEVKHAVSESGITSGVCYIYVPHTTAGVTINEGADPSVVKDIINAFNSVIPFGAGYLHAEGNSDSHIKTALVGASEAVIVENGTLVLGTWQAIFFCEFDGPRSRNILIKVIGD